MSKNKCTSLKSTAFVMEICDWEVSISWLKSKNAVLDITGSKQIFVLFSFFCKQNKTKQKIKHSNTIVSHLNPAERNKNHLKTGEG